MSESIETAVYGKRKKPTGVAPAIALVNPKFPHNVGKAVRAASCFGVKQVWFTGSRVSLEPRGKKYRLPREERMKGYRDVELRVDWFLPDKTWAQLATLRTVASTHDDTDDVDLQLVLVPAGEFLMGSPASQEHSCESPQHIVRFERPFYIGRFPVTQAQWETVMGSNPSRHKGDPDLPVDQVSWFDCQEFCETLCDRQKRVFRLPSEAEWEYACRAGTTIKADANKTVSRLADFRQHIIDLKNELV
jgi:formylglycine-generating enzyme required for sulfatase activity